MPYQKRLVAYIDIIGFRDLVAKTINQDGSENATVVNDITRLILSSPSVLEPSPGWARAIEGYTSPATLTTTYFSDSIVTSCSLDNREEILQLMLGLFWYAVKIAELGITCRGGVAFGELSHSSRMVFGPALVRAYDLESKVAVYPRIVFDKSLYKLSKDSTPFNADFSGFGWTLDDFVKKDFDDFYYINYISAKHGMLWENQWLEHRRNLSKIIRLGLKHSDPRIKAKYQWMQRKFRQRFR